MDTPINITISGYKVYYSCFHYHRVHVVRCDLQGKTQWTFENENVLKRPFGISADNKDNVYVVGSETNNVVIISPDGQKYKELLTTRDGLDYPCSVNFERTTNQLLVSHDNNNVCLYKVI